MRGKGEGAIYRVPADSSKPLKYWTAAVELPPNGGTRRRKVIRSRDKAKVIKGLAELRNQLSIRGDLPSADQTVAQWFMYWLEMIGPKEVRPKTLAGYKSTINNHVTPVIGRIRLDKLGPAHINRVTTQLAATHSSTYALLAHRIMSSVLADAEREGRIGRNPAKLARAPRKTAAALDVLTVAEAARIVAAFKDTSEGLLWATFLLTGARRGELLGLEWDRVGDELELSWQLQRHTGVMVTPADYEYRHLTGGLYLTRPKSSAGWRVVPLVEPLKGALERWRTLQPPNTYGLVFATNDGNPLDPDWTSKAWPKALAAAGIDKHVRLHDLRHTAVDLLYEAGVPEAVIMEIVGHSTRAMTRGYKSRGNRPQLTDAMTRMSELLTN